MKPAIAENILDETTLQQAVMYLHDLDPIGLGLIIDQYGPPPLWAREPGFPTLIHIILEQQVSLASARACFTKLNQRLPVLNPEQFLTLNDADLLQIGFSHQKARYARNLAEVICGGDLDFEVLIDLPDEQVFSQLTALTGIGPWTANIYLLMALGRPDIWPGGDLALLVALQLVLKLDHRPDPAEFTKWGEKWRPYRSVAARILWHFYLSE